MTTTEIDTKILETLKAVVSERPNYAYAAPEHLKDETGSCFYVHQEHEGFAAEPGCGVGVLLHRLGVPLETLRAQEGVGAYTVVPRFFPGISRKTQHILSYFQRYQDDGKPWRESLDMAISTADREYL